MSSTSLPIYRHAGFEMTEFQPREMVASDHPIVSEGVTVAAGQVLKRGSVLGKLTSNGHYVLSHAVDEADPPVAIADGSQVPDRVLAEDVDASAGAKSGVITYKTGQFLASNLSFGRGHTAASTRDVLRGKGIHI